MKNMLFYFLFIVSAKGEFAENFTDTHFTMSNWTTCEQFLQNTSFNLSRIIDVDWKIFYTWCDEYEESYQIRFEVPSATLVDRFKVGLGKNWSASINWTDAEIFMQTSIDFSALFIRTNVSGLYKILPSIAFEYSHIPLPDLIFALKTVDDYLGVMNCRFQFCYALAPVNKMPPDHKLEEAAKKLNYTSDYGMSYLEKEKTEELIKPAPIQEIDDAEDDEELELERDPNKIQIF